MDVMSRPKEFEEIVALDAAMETFREHGYEGSSTAMLVDAMKIGRQSLYDTFGGKWQLYLAAVRRYGLIETSAHIGVLKGKPKAIDGIRAAIERVVRDARVGCLGVNSICEFGESKPDLRDIRATAGQALCTVFVARIREAQAAGDVAADLDPDSVMDFLSASFAGIRVAARGGAHDKQLEALGQLTFRALI
ncbi:TetR/AcrR family transcriptional regulator [Sphingomonas sp. PAMC 26605]|uniref:TetR/AcrR family transcriptional regulator n=1 Tax=Sphingomonas sp. PAMC 26605 TaxID=1112214 RepID=UPI00026CB5C3|nr:TetR/AcrR family transcriptional regulator [Sphingomonas sp. PAMC 26605]